MIDPLVDDWAALDRLVKDVGGCSAVIRTCHWHERNVAQASERYGAPVWALSPPEDSPKHPFDNPVPDGGEIVAGITADSVERDDEISLWLPDQRALLFGDAMIRRETGELRVCPDSWTQPAGGPERLREILRGLSQRPLEHVLVSHGPLVLGDGKDGMRSALA